MFHVKSMFFYNNLAKSKEMPSTLHLNLLMQQLNSKRKPQEAQMHTYLKQILHNKIYKAVSNALEGYILSIAISKYIF